MEAYTVRDGQDVPLPQIVIFGPMTLVSVFLVVRFVLSIDHGAGNARGIVTEPVDET